MNYKMMGRFIAMILFAEGAFMLPALMISIVHSASSATFAFIVSIAAIFLLATILLLLSKGAKKDFFAADGFLSVGIGWIIMSLLGALPFYISGEIPHYIDAVFEIVSGYTTTGATILKDVEVLSRGTMYWRCFSHWLGGMGVLVFLLAVAPRGGKNEGFTMHLLRAESPGPDVGKLVPKMRQTAIVLYVTYIVLTLLNVVALLFCKMDLYDAVCTAFATAGTGGFGIRNDSIGGYNAAVQIVCTVFMLLFGINFSCYYLLLMRQFRSILKDEELRFYLFCALGAIGLIAWNIRGLYANFGESLRHAAFQAVSIMTTTGFSTVDFDLWPTFSKTILVILMFIGASAGSTGGGIKCARILLLFKSLRRNINQILHPHRIQTVRTSGKTVDESVLSNTNAYFSAYIIILLISTLVVSLDGFSFTTNFTAVLSCLNNIGPGLEAVGPTCNFAGFSIPSKLILIFNMLAGRLEIFPILVLFNLRAWKRR